MKFNKIITLICLGISLQPVGLMASTNLPTEITTQQTNKVINLGTLDQYIVNLNSNNMYITRDGAKAVKINNGDIVDDFGNYTICMKDKGQLVKFSIDAPDIKIVTNYNELYEAVYKVAYNNEDTLKFRFSGEYTKDEVIEDLKYIAANLRFSNPLLVSKIQSASAANSNITVKLANLLTDEQYGLSTAKAKQQLDDYIQSLDLTKSDVQLELDAVKWICSKATYKENGQQFGDTAHNLQSISQDGLLVCDGYAKALMYILNTIGIPTEIIIGDVESGTHAWNLVQLDDGLYHVDVTWADTSYVNDNYFNYINENDEQMSKTHVWDKDKYPKANGEKYLNTKIFDFVTPDELTDKNLHMPILLNNTQDINQYLNPISKLTGKTSISYYRYDKYGDTVTLLNL